MAQAAARLPDPSFVAQLLAPLPETAEPVLAPAFRREINRLIGHTWRARYRHFLAAQREFERAGIAKSIAYSEGSRAQIAQAEIEAKLSRSYLIDAIGYQMRLCIPNREALKWKRRWQKLDGGRPEWDEVIARDEAELKGEG